MPEYEFMIFAFAAAMFYGARREYGNDNARDARLLAAFGVGGMLAGGTVLMV